MSNLPFTLPACDQPATERIEVYSPDPAGGAFGSLDASLYSCDHHSIEVASKVWAWDLTAHKATMAPGVQRKCGEFYVFPTGNMGGTK